MNSSYKANHFNEDRIIWRGQPKYKARWAFLDVIGGGAELGPYTAVLPLCFLVLIIALITSIASENYIMVILYSVILFLLLFGAEFHKATRREHTKYILTTKNLIIHDYWYGKKKKHIVELSNIIKFHLVNYSDNCGEIHFYTKSKKTFSTRNFWSGSERPTLALEDIDNASKTFEIFKRTLIEYQNN